MKNQKRNPTLGTRGDDVLHLKLSLFLLGFESMFGGSAPDPTHGNPAPRLPRLDLFDAATAAAVRAVQDKAGLPATGVVDEPTAAVIEAMLEEGDRFAVYGFVSAGGDPADGVLAMAFDRDLRNEQELGKAPTRRGGFYFIPYKRENFSNAEKLRADLVVRVHDANGNNVLTADEKTHFNAARVHRIDVALEGGQYSGPSEFERYLADLKPVLQKVALRKLTDEDISFLHHETGIPVDRLRFLKLDEAFRHRTELEPAVFYGLLRQGLPTYRRLLLAEKPSRLEGALKASLERNIIPRALAANLDGILEFLHKMAVEAAFAKPVADEAPALGQVLLAGAIEQDKAARFVEFARRYEGDAEKFWDAAGSDAGLDAEALAGARFALTVNTLVQGHVKTLKAIRKIASNKGWGGDPRKIAGIRREEWRKLTARTGYPDDFDDAKAFADAIADRIEITDPTAVVAARLAGDPDLGADEARAFLDANPDFDLLHTHIDGFLENGADLGAVQDREGTRRTLLKLQSTARMAPERDRYDSMTALIRHGYTSPMAVMHVGSATFMETMTPIAGDASAWIMLENAKVRAEAGAMLAPRYRDLVGDRLPVLPGYDGEPEPETDVEIPDWVRLFGLVGGCACEHCRSLYSPAAYMVDLLQFLKEVPRGEKQALAELRARRPDIEHIELNCANATVTLPYIDLVNEILEVAVAGPGSVDWRDYQTPSPNGEGQAALERRLRAEPQHELAAAYGDLSTAEYPWMLPFSADQERVLLFARHLGLDLSEIRALFGRDEGRVARDYLNLSQPEWDLLARPVGGVDLTGIWGVGDPSDLEQIPVFMRQSGLSYDDVRALTEGWFLSADGPADITMVLPEGADPCDIGAYRLDGLRDSSGNPDRHILDQIHRFLRLRRKLDWTTAELDGVLKALARPLIDGNTIEILARAKRAADGRRVATLRLVEATGAALASLLGLAETEMAMLSVFVGIGDPASADADQRLRLVEASSSTRAAGLDLTLLSYVLLGRDQTPPAFAPADADLRGFLRALHDLVQEQGVSAVLTSDEIADLVTGNVATHLGLEVAVCARLISPVLDPGTGTETAGALIGAQSDPADPAIVDLAYFAVIAPGAAPPDEAEPLAYENAALLLIRLDRVARLLIEFAIDRRELDVIAAVGAENGFLDLGQILDPSGAAFPLAPDLFDGYLALAAAKRLQSEMPRADMDVFDLITVAADTVPTDVEMFDSLNAATGWSIDPLTREAMRDSGGAEIDIPAVLSASMGFDRADFRRADTYARLQRAVKALRRWRIMPEELILWGDPSQPVDVLATSLRDTARARQSDDDAWYEILAPLMDILRERKRDALLSHLIHRDRLEGPATLYERYLIDPEMSSCMLTSRIKQANASIQLFAQRIQMNLEDGLRPSPATADSWHRHWRQWEWRRNYRVWEANRKVFLYPENWILPELRDDKSPFFKELENELLQDEVNDTTVERAYRGYLKKVNEVARLDVRGFYLEQDKDWRGRLTKEVLHVFARTFTEPHVYYYRRRNMATKVWSAWEKVDLSIESDQLIPVVHDGRLMLLWPQFREVVDGRQLEVSLAFSVYREGRWDAARIGKDKHVVPAQRHNDFTLRLDNEGGLPRILVYRQYYEEPIEGLALPDSYSLCQHAFVFNICEESFQVETVAPHRLLFHPERVDAKGMAFREDESDGDEFNVIMGAYESDEVDFSRDPAEIIDDLVERYGPILGVFLIPILLSADWKLQILLQMENLRPSPVLNSTPGTFEIVPAHQDRQFLGRSPFFFQDDSKSFLVTTVDAPSSGNPVWDAFAEALGAGHKYVFELFYHPFLCDIIERFSRGGIDEFLAPSSFLPTGPRGRLERVLLDRQYTDPQPSPMWNYDPTERVSGPYPLEGIDFGLEDSYSLYNWELFFHIPLLVAVQLSETQQFEEAQHWFHYIFDPTDISPHPDPARFWRVKPFFELAQEPPRTLSELLRLIASGDAAARRQIEVWQDDPFNPHAIVRLRTVAYMKTTVMKYLDNLIAWGDDLFQRDTMETINEATQIYVLAAEILGSRPVLVDALDPPSLTYASLGADDRLDDLGNAWIDLDSLVPADLGAPSTEAGAPVLLPYFCIPANDNLLSYWDTVADRLFKIRHCMSIEGQVRRLPLFEPPIDPALLVRARAAGLDLRTVLGRLASGRPHYRYAVTYQKALEFCGEVRALGSALLAALEKKDAEEFGLLRSRHEINLLTQVGRIKQQQIEEAKESLEGLRKGRKLAEKRHEFYTNASQGYRNAPEQAQIDHLHVAHGFEVASQSIKSLAPLLHAIPNLTLKIPPETTFGGTHLGSAVNAAADAIGIFASLYSFQANMSSLTGSHDRRRDDWNLQADLAEKEMAQTDKQIVAAEIRLAIAEQDRDNHRQQIKQAREVEGFLKRKFTSRELYGWMAGQLSALHYQAYQMALDLALRAEAAANQELGLPPTDQLSVVGFDHREGGRKGLLAGEKLNQELRRLDAGFLERNARKMEITKHISLAMLVPEALILLKAAGSCSIGVPEWLFDLDYPGHYNRRIKSVSLTIPCVTGPYTSVSATLTLRENSIRHSASPGPAYPRNSESGDDRFIDGISGNQSIATSTAQNDGGVFELNFRDERYLPFEGAGAISDWTLELSGKWLVDPGDGSDSTTVDLSQFDFDTISDVVLHLNYTAQEASDGGALERAALGHLQALFVSVTDAPLARLISLRHEFPDEWYRFLNPAVEGELQALTIPLTQDRFPFLFQNKTVSVREFSLFVKVDPDHSATHNETDLWFTLASGDVAPTPDDAGPGDRIELDTVNGLLRGIRSIPGTPGNWTVNAWLDGGRRLEAESIEDMALICHYIAGSE